MKNLILFISYVHKNYVIEDWSYYTKIGKKIIYPIWFIHAFIVWIACPIFIPEFLFKQSNMYKILKGIMNSNEYKKLKY